MREARAFAPHDRPAFDVPPAWERLKTDDLTGTLMVVGAPDTGKSTFARYLYGRLCASHERLAFVDGDVGQASLGPPATMTLVVRRSAEEAFPPEGPRIRFFVGSNSPRGHLLPTLIGVHKLTRLARELGASATVLDTTGLVSAAEAGGVLKQAKVDLLEPTVVFAIQRGSELEHLLVPLRRSARTRVVDLPAAGAARPRNAATRRAHRAEAFRRYFAAADLLEVPWTRLAVIPAPTFSRGRLAALEDVRGLVLALGIVLEADAEGRTVVLRTPASSLEGADALRLGDLSLDPERFCEV
jgi:polynucleotide 5'-hydroxyl-kinase GRC3/NOL9